VAQSMATAPTLPTPSKTTKTLPRMRSGVFEFGRGAGRMEKPRKRDERVRG
jgi:hypothetical protein